MEVVVDGCWDCEGGCLCVVFVWFEYVGFVVGIG